MDIEKLIERLYTKQQSYASYTDSELAHVLEDAITALSTLRAENEKLRAESIMHHNAADNYFSELTEYRQERNEALAELEQVVQKYETAVKLQVKMTEISNRQMAELEQVKAERDAAVSWAQKYTESIDMPCVACKHNTGDYVCTAICGNCGPMGAESCKWEFDFSGELKED